MGKHTFEDDVGVDKQARITHAVQELREAVRDIDPSKRTQLMAHVYRELLDEWKKVDHE